MQVTIVFRANPFAFDTRQIVGVYADEAQARDVASRETSLRAEVFDVIEPDPAQ